MKGQASIEYIILIGIILVILVPLLYYTIRESSQNINVNQASDVVNSLAKTADTVYSLGPGNKDYVWVTIPEGVESSLISDNEILIRVHAFGGVSDIFATTIANVSGQVPVKKGPSLIPVEMLDSGVVLIGNISTVCGDSICDVTETCETCEVDCGACAVCGDSACSGTETCETCEVDCGACEGEEEEYCGNGVCGLFENCLCEDCEGEQNGCESNEICQEGSCVSIVPPTIANCADYCVYIGYSNGVCRQNAAQCTKFGETWESGGDTYCIAGTTGDSCCCIP